ncbi:Methyltransferase domain-containing protein [Ectothiorhodosinus mongolicus]|uniref:Methyltransferase domain-containing protein n=1 Tax=Ectothiorhodosinus mongolicus TaxID=233100 RepID=A0A1R3W2X3_9GAMM|nr:class I SAM-dependent methyltransferase [Ectothiorhodosinus mongolicus]ULX57423.1 class I SAM-dependent methyltransferase [Ectothiorhodosinus mongolicus]SIT72113.1 Methyltransferase domain-containing protein [Ectothiorhodosinus mongolicus]
MKDFWDIRYAGPDYVYGTAPNAYLRAHHALYRPGQKVLSVADGEGRNGVWLASRGLDVTSVDYSEHALAKAQSLAQLQGVTIETVLADVCQWQWPQAAYDHVVAIYLHVPPEQRPRLHRGLIDALKPGGTLLLEAFGPEQLDYDSGGPDDLDMLYSGVMLREDFADAEIMELAELVVELDEGPGHQGLGAVTRALIRRPE